MRQLTSKEIESLQANSCYADDWKNISVADGFNANSVSKTSFSGKCQLGTYSGVTEINGVPFQRGINNARLHNCVVGNDVVIDGISRYISNYEIADGAIVVDNCEIFCNGSTAFGTDTKIAVLNENGGRSIPLSPALTAQLAYLAVMFRDYKVFTERICTYLDEKSKEYISRSADAPRGYIGKDAIVIGNKKIANVWIGENATVKDCTSLENGIVKSSASDPSSITTDVLANNFILCNGAKVMDGAIIRNTFVGQNTEVGLGFSATDTFFSANCQAFHGESCSLFAGPFTVSHHKSTLLIAAMFSFMNAGSATNQSNHYYRLGPNHEGVLQRGSKTASGSYVLWPAVTGVFTLVKGKHGGNLDTRKLPFSYLIEQNSETWIYPGSSMKSCGTMRDINKWKKRDKRKTIDDSSDIINFDVMSPFIVAEVAEGFEFLTEKQHHQRRAGVNYHKYGRAKMHSVAVDEGVDLYAMFLSTFAVRLLKSCDTTNLKALYEKASSYEIDKWADIAGAYCSRKKLFGFIDKVANCKDYSSVITNFLSDLKNGYEEEKKMWGLKFILEQRFNGNIEAAISADAIADIISEGETAEN
ncbi:MAG: DUF4954 family protein, partial [Paludibacteraceae bacterium]|nr:DUF4954 family protein [Paludibacteraceae bacterium]